MVKLDAAQTENLSTALIVARAWAVASGVDPTAACERVAFAWWTESKGYIYANDGTNTSNSPGFDKHPEWPGILRRSLNIRHDKVGSNGRSTGGLQQISADVDGGWADMAGTMDPAISTARFLARIVITGNPVYAGTLLTSTGTRRVAVELSSPIAADVLRVQQPLADEAESPNYNAAQVATAREIVAQLSPTATGAVDNTDWILPMTAPTPEQQSVLDAQWWKIQKPILDRFNEVLTDVVNKLYLLDVARQQAPSSGVVSNDRFNEVLTDVVNRLYLMQISFDNLSKKVDALGAALDAK